MSAGYCDINRCIGPPDNRIRMPSTREGVESQTLDLCQGHWDHLKIVLEDNAGYESLAEFHLVHAGA